MRDIVSLGNLESGFSKPNSINAQTYILKDTFSTDVAAGSVNGTTAEPTGQVRTVTDTNSKISISGGKLSFATGEVISDGVWYPQTARAVGKMLMFDAIPNTGNTIFGFDTNQTGGIGSSAMQLRGGVIGGTASGTLFVGTYTADTQYKISMPLRATGGFKFIKGGPEYPYWTLVWLDANDSNATIYPTVSANGTTFVGTFDNIRIPSRLWLPSPIVSDSFDRADGALGTTDGAGHAESTGLGSGGSGKVWTGSTWSISSNTAINTPTTGANPELLTDGGLEDWASATDLTSWSESVSGTSTVNRETTGPHSGTYCSRLDVDSSNSIVSFTQGVTNPAGSWIKISVWMKNDGAGTGAVTTALRPNGVTLDPGTTWTQYVNTDLSISANLGAIGGKRVNATSRKLYFDDFSVKILTLSELFSSITTSTKNYIADVKVTQTGVKGTQGGMVLNLDSTLTPTNFIVAYLDGYGNATLVKCVAGTYTSVISAAITYSDGAILRVIKDGTSYSLYYNNAQVGSTSTISDAGIVNNTLHGLFSTYSGNTLDDFVCYPRGTSGEYETLNNF